MTGKAFIVGCSGLELTARETRFFEREKPWGFILFARNIDNPDQVRQLCAALRRSVDREDAPILIDQEGGRVQRLRPPHWYAYPPAAMLGALHAREAKAGERAVWLLSRLHAHDLLDMGIDVDCLPVLDVPAPDGHDVIGNRAYGRDPDVVAHLGRLACEGLIAGGVLPVVKHIPGHGRATADSHLALPHVATEVETLKKIDFEPFRRLADQSMAMTAHVVYEALDKDAPATTSKRMVEEIIRGWIGFDGLLMSDDVSMHALSGDFAARTDSIVAAGCDIVLHCNGDMAEMEKVAARVPQLAGMAAERAARALATKGKPDGNFDAKAGRDELSELIAPVAESAPVA